MFTGIVQAMGRIAATEPRGDGIRVALDIGVHESADVAVGDSIAVNGCCLTVVEVNGSTLTFDVSAETLACTTGLDRVGDVNVEMALRLSDRLGGHLVTGHVDGVGTVTPSGACGGRRRQLVSRSKRPPSSRSSLPRKDRSRCTA
jgi:riboflavin synthase